MFKKLLNKPIEKAKDRLSEYVDLKLEYLKLSGIEKSAPLAATLIVVLFLMFIASIMLFFLGMGIAKLFAIWLNSELAGYMICAGIFLLFFVIIIVFFKSIIKKLTNTIGKYLTKNL